MTRYSKVNIVYRLQKWMDSVPGQTFLNYAYSWGAAVVILGTLFKLTHLPGANLMLYLGMGTEVVVFFLSAFDRPFDKTADGMDLPTHLNQEVEETVVTGTPVETPAVAAAVTAGTTGVTGGPQTIIIGGGGGYESHESHKPYKPNDVNEAYEPNETYEANEPNEPNEVQEPAPVSASAPVIPPLTPDMTEATNAYVEELKKLTEVLERVSEQSKRLTTDSEEMENLNRTLTGICKVYEMQLKSASSQIGTIDEINEQTKKMAQQIEQLNNIYARMIEAMTMKMKVE